MNELGLLLTLIVMIFLCAMAWGVCYRVLRIVTSTLAFFSYIGLYSLEVILPFVPFLKFHLPAKGVKRVIADIAGAFAFLFAMLWAYSFGRHLMILEPDVFAHYFAEGKIIPIQATILIVICLVVLYAISYFSERDVDEAPEKIEKLNIPDLVKKAAGL